MAPSTEDVRVTSYGATIPNDPHTDSYQQNATSIPTWTNNPQADDIPILEQLCGSRKKLRIAMLGAGVSGINFFKRAEEKLKHVDIVCYEKNSEVGGTWLENRYPGCACDIPSAVYQFPWHRKPWSHYYSYSPEIWEYIRSVAYHYDFVDKYVKLRHQVLGISWSDDNAQWKISVKDHNSDRTVEDYADVIIDGTGILNKWKWPKIKGLHDFKGELLHSAQWDPTLSLKGKRVALLGAGSSGVQILPNIYDEAEKIYHWVRNKVWITAGFAQAFAGPDGANFAYNDDQYTVLEKDADAHLSYSKMIESEMNQRFQFIINGSEAQNGARAYSENEMRSLLKNRPELVEQIMPTDFFVGCRRPTPGNGYLEALAGAKTTCYNTQLERLTAKGFIDPHGVEQEVDVFICATGFDTTYKPRYPFLVNGKDMREKWKDHPHTPSYLSLGYAEVPNYFLFGGAYTPAAHGSFFPIVDAYSNYVVQAIEKIQVEQIRSIRPKQHVVDTYLRHADSFLKRTAWTGPCSSWFKGGTANGTPAIYPGSRLHFLRLLEKVRWEDYDIEYDSEVDMWRWLGNGFHVCERDGSDITWYLGKPDKIVDEKWLRSVMSGDKGIKMEKH